jgi:hypothetical protein
MLPNTPTAPLSENEDTPSTPTAGLSTLGTPVKVTSGGKGAMSTISPTAGVTMDEQSSKAILGNMQKMLDEYNDPYKKFQDSLQKASAWTKYDKTPAFEQIQRQEEQDRSNKYNISQNMAALQAAQNQTKTLNQYMSQSSSADGTSGTGGAGGANIPGIPENQQQWAKYLSATNQPEFQKLLTSYNVKQPDALKIMDAVKGMQDTPQNRELLRQTFPKSFEPATTYDAQGRETKTMPDIGALFKQANVPTATGSGVFSDPSIHITSAQRTAQQGKDLYQTSVNAGTPGVQPNGIPVAKPGTSPHETLPPGDVYDIDSKTLSDAGRTELAQRGYYQPYGRDSVHWQKIPMTGAQTAPATTLPVMKAQIQAQPQPTAGDIPSPLAGDTSVPGVAAKYTNLAAGNKSFIEGPLKDLTSRVDVQRNDIINADKALDAINKADFGPGGESKMGVIKLKMMSEIAGGPKLTTPQEEAFYLAGQTLENVKQSQVALGAKAAMGAQYTGKESDNFAKTLAGISDKNVYIKSIYQMQKAKAMIDNAHLEYLNRHQDDPVTANANWNREGGIGQRTSTNILTDNVDAFKKMHTDEKARKWLAENPNNPKAAKVREQLGDNQ